MQSYAQVSLIMPLGVFVFWWFKFFAISPVGSAVESPRHTEPCERLRHSLGCEQNPYWGTRAIRPISGWAYSARQERSEAFDQLVVGGVAGVGDVAPVEDALAAGVVADAAEEFLDSADASSRMAGRLAQAGVDHRDVGLDQRMILRLELDARGDLQPIGERRNCRIWASPMSSRSTGAEPVARARRGTLCDAACPRSRPARCRRRGRKSPTRRRPCPASPPAGDGAAWGSRKTSLMRCGAGITNTR